VAGLLHIPEQAVHDRAHAALAILAPREAKGLDPTRRAEIADYLLGQQAAGERLRTRTLLTRDAGASAWASATARELAPLGGDLPEVPVPAGAPASGAQERVTLAQVAASAPPAPAAPTSSAPSSRRGGAILLAVLLAAAVVAVILIVSGGGSSHKKSATTSTTASKAKNEGTFPLHAPAGSRSTGKVEIVSEEGKRAFFIQAEHIPASRGFFYAVWLYNSPSSALPLSKSPPVGKSHKLAGAALLPSNASKYREMLLTRETKTRPTHPGHIVLRGRIALG